MIEDVALGGTSRLGREGAITYAKDGSISFVRNGARINLPTIGNNTGQASFIYFGTDGSYAIGRTGYASTMAGNTLDYPLWHIRFEGEEEPVGNVFYVAAYRDRLNYIAVRDNTHGYGGTADPEEIFVTQEGKQTHLGTGAPIKVWSLNELLVQVSLDPVTISPDPYGSLSYLRYYRDGKATELGRFDFLGSCPDRTLILKRQGLLAFWRAGKFTSIYRIPAAWQAVAANGQGDVLLAFGYGRDWEEGRKAVAANWEFAMVRKGVFRLLSLPPTEKPLAIGTANVSPFGQDLSFSFEARRRYNGSPFRIRPKAAARTRHDL